MMQSDWAEIYGDEYMDFLREAAESREDEDA